MRFYSRRGTAERQIEEGKQAVNMTRLSCHRFRPIKVRLWLSAIVYNLGNLWLQRATIFSLPGKQNGNSNSRMFRGRQQRERGP